MQTSGGSRRKAWFKSVFGFAETPSYATNQSRFTMEGDDVMVSGDRRFHVGPFETPSLRELRERIVRDASSSCGGEGIRFRHLASPTGVGPLHEDPANAGAVFQAASQFNCLEMVGPGVSPRRGITSYINDNTQGPKCALACPAGTAYRNYRCCGGAGQGRVQIDCLADVGAIVGNESEKIWKMSNGYALPTTKRSMGRLGARLEADPSLVAQAEEALRVGVQWDTEVECRSGHRVCQVYASAVPVAYAKSTPSVDWAPFARLVLRGAYDATLCAARCLAAQRPPGERITVYLTSIGGGAFGNRKHWIGEAIVAALEKHRDAPLDVW